MSLSGCRFDPRRPAVPLSAAPSPIVRLHSTALRLRNKKETTSQHLWQDCEVVVCRPNGAAGSNVRRTQRFRPREGLDLCPIPGGRGAWEDRARAVRPLVERHSSRRAGAEGHMGQVTVSRSKSCVVVEIVTASLMDPLELDALGADLYRLVDEQDARRLLLDFGKVQYISSQAIGILAKLHKKTNALKGGLLVLCNLSPRLLE